MPAPGVKSHAEGCARAPPSCTSWASRLLLEIPWAKCTPHAPRLPVCRHLHLLEDHPEEYRQHLRAFLQTLEAASADGSDAWEGRGSGGMTQPLQQQGGGQGQRNGAAPPAGLERRLAEE